MIISHTTSVVAHVNKDRVPQQGTRLRSKNMLLEQTPPIKQMRITTPRILLTEALKMHQLKIAKEKEEINGPERSIWR